LLATIASALARRPQHVDRLQAHTAHAPAVLDSLARAHHRCVVSDDARSAHEQLFAAGVMKP
jgi:hypothetical protein